jgi:hypothetical protein
MLAAIMVGALVLHWLLQKNWISVRWAAPLGSHSRTLPNDEAQNLPPARVAFGRVIRIAGNASRLGPRAIAGSQNFHMQARYPQVFG